MKNKIMMDKIKLKRNALLIIVIVLFFHVAVNFYILNKSEIIRDTDDGSRIIEGFHFHQEIVNKEYKNVEQKFLTLLIHPKLFPLAEGLTLTLLGKAGLGNVNSMILFSNAIFLFVLLLSVYKIGSALYDEETGLLAAILLSFSPLIFGHSRINMLDFPLTAMISLCFLSLLKTKNFTSLLFGLLTAVLFSLAQLTKETAVIFLLPPFLYYFLASLNIREKRKQKVINFCFTLLVFLILMGAVYLSPTNKEAFKRYWEASFLTHYNDNRFYYFTVGRLYLGMVFLIIAAPLLLSYIANIKKRNGFLTLYLFCPFFIFSFSPNQVPRFLMPVLPALFLVLASEAFNLKHQKIRKVYIGILIFAMIFQYTKLNFFPKTPMRYSIHGGGLLNIYKDKDFYVIERLLGSFKDVKKENPQQNEPFLIVFTSQEFVFALYCEFVFRGMPFLISCPSSRDIPDALPPGTVNWKEYLLTADYVVDTSGDIRHRGALEDISGEFKKSLEENARFFKKVDSFKTSNGDWIFVYKKVKISGSNI